MELDRCKEIERSIIKRYRKSIWRPFIRGIQEYDLIQDGDKIAVCISGGKDSMLLAKLIQELLVDKNEISIRELDEKAKEQGISGRTMRDVRSRMKNELEYQVNEKQENSIRLKE